MKDIKCVSSKIITYLDNRLSRLNPYAHRRLGNFLTSDVGSRSYQSVSGSHGLHQYDFRNRLATVMSKILRDIAGVVAPISVRTEEQMGSQSMAIPIDPNTGVEDNVSSQPPTIAVDVSADEQTGVISTAGTISLNHPSIGTRSLIPADESHLDSPPDDDDLDWFRERADCIDVKEIAREASSLLIDVRRSRQSVRPRS